MFNKLVTVVGGLGIVGTVSLGGFHAIKPIEDTEWPAAGIDRVAKIDTRVAQLSAQSQQRFDRIQKSIDIQQSQTGTLVEQSVTNDYQYWTAQHDIAMLQLKKNPFDPSALALKQISEKKITDLQRQLAK